MKKIKFITMVLVCVLLMTSGCGKDAKKAKENIAKISSLNVALALLNKLCDDGDEWLLDKINS